MAWTNEWKFDVSNVSHRRSFSEFIEFVRINLGVDGIVMHDARRLPPQQDNPLFQDLELYAGEGTVVTLRLRTDNLYVVGFRNAHGQWFRFAGGAPIPGIDSVELPFNGSYVGANGIGPLNVVNLSTPSVENAIHGLAGYDGGHNQHLRTWLRTLIVSFVESSRFTTIADTIATVMRGSVQVLNGNLIGQIHNWGSLSTAVLEAANNVVENPDNIFPSFHNVCGIDTAYQAAETLGLVLIMVHNFANAGVYDDVSLGITLLEVHSVVILNIDGEEPGDLYGTVRIHDSFGNVNLFLRDRSDIQQVWPGDWAELVWPDRAISAADDFAIELDLWDRDSVSPDDEVSRGEVVWISREAASSKCNELRSTQVKGEYGLVEVFYAVVTNAVVATMEVLLIDGDGESVADVYGAITATTKMGPASRSLDYDLFSQARSDQVSVPVNTNIPLRRRVITAVLGSRLIVTANLWDKDTFPDISPDDQIAVGSVDFEPRFQGEDAQQITGPNGKVQVRVTWSVSHS